MNYREWEKSVHPDIKNDVIWKMEGYKLALYLSDVSWFDSQKMIAERYSRISNKEKARFYEIALGSARETRDWYFKSRHLLSEEVTTKRIRLLTKIIKLLLSMINDRRKAHKL